MASVKTRALGQVIGALAIAAIGASAGYMPGISAQAATLDRPYFKASSIVVVIGASDSSENGGVAPVAVDFYLLDNVASGTIGNDIIGQDGFTTNYNGGTFNASSDGSGSGYEFEIIDQTSGGVFTSAGPHQTLDENDSYSEFGLDEDTDIDIVTGNRASRFLVASNAPFDIYAEASDLVASGDFSAYDLSNIRYTLRMNVTGGGGVWRWGQRAQNPGTGGSGIVTAVNSLDDMDSGPVKVYDGGRRTARQRGTLLQQAVGFQSRYRLRGAGALVDNYDFSMGAGALGATVTYTVYTP